MDEYRKIIFEQNLATIKAHNADHTKTYKMAVFRLLKIINVIKGLS